LCDALGNSVRLILTPGNVADCTQAAPLLKEIGAVSVLADKGYDTNTSVQLITDKNANVVIQPKANGNVQRLCGFALYRERNLVERCFNKIKLYQAVATRYAKH
jgi:transposase